MRGPGKVPVTQALHITLAFGHAHRLLASPPNATLFQTVPTGPEQPKDQLFPQMAVHLRQRNGITVAGSPLGVGTVSFAVSGGN